MQCYVKDLWLEKSLSFTVEKHDDRIEISTKKDKCTLDLKSRLAFGDLEILEYILYVGVSSDLLPIVRDAYGREIRQGDATLKVSLSFSKYSVEIYAPIREIIPLDENYYYFLSKHLKDENYIAMELEPKEVLIILNYLENGGKIEEVVKAIALGGLHYLNEKDKLKLLKEKIDNLLHRQLVGMTNVFRDDYIFKIDKGYIITTYCYDWYLVKEKEVLLNGERKLTRRGIEKLIDWMGWKYPKILNARIEEVLNVLESLI